MKNKNSTILLIVIIALLAIFGYAYTQLSNENKDLSSQVQTLTAQKNTLTNQIEMMSTDLKTTRVYLTAVYEDGGVEVYSTGRKLGFGSLKTLRVKEGFSQENTLHLATPELVSESGLEKPSKEISITFTDMQFPNFTYSITKSGIRDIETKTINTGGTSGRLPSAILIYEETFE